MFIQKNVLCGIKDSSRYCLFHSQIMEAGVEYFRVKWTNKVYSMPLFLTMSHCCEMDWDLFFSQMDSGLISHHWSSRVQITFVGKIKIVPWIILKCTNPLSWYIASVRLESFIRSKRELQHFTRRKGQLSVDHISLSFLYSALCDKFKLFPLFSDQKCYHDMMSPIFWLCLVATGWCRGLDICVFSGPDLAR